MIRRVFSYFWLYASPTHLSSHGALLPDLDSGVAIDENNMVNLIQVDESLEGRRGPADSLPGECEELSKEGTEATVQPVQQAQQVQQVQKADKLAE